MCIDANLNAYQTLLSSLSHLIFDKENQIKTGKIEPKKYVQTVRPDNIAAKKKEKNTNFRLVMNEKKIQLRVSRFSLCVFRCLFSIVVILDGEGENRGKPKRQ